MSQFMPEGNENAPQPGVSTITPSNPETTSEDIALMQRVLAAASRNPNLIPADFMAYVIDYVQTQNLMIPIGQVFGYQRIAPQVISSFAEVPAPVDGQIILLKVGSSAPFVYVQMMYDQEIAQWVSEEFPAGGGSGSQNSGTDVYIDVGGYTGISWSSVHNAGLTMQIKWSGALAADVGTTAKTQVKIVFGNLDTSFTTATLMNKTSAGTGSFVAAGVDWTTISDPGDYNMAVIGLQVARNGGGLATVSAGIVGRFIK